MAEGSQATAPPNGAQMIAAVAGVPPVAVAAASAAIGLARLPGQRAIVAPDAMQAQNAIFINAPRVKAFSW